MSFAKKIKRNITLVICARCSSKRFPNKVLKKINGIPLILQVYERVKNSKYVDNIIVATSNKNSDDKFKLKQYVDGLEDILITRLVEDLMIYLSDIE